MQLDLFDFASERAAERAPAPSAAWDAPESTLWGRAWLANIRRLCQPKRASELAFGEKLLAGGRLQSLHVRRGHLQGAFTNRAGGTALVNVDVKLLPASRWLALDRLSERCGDQLFTSDELPDDVLSELFGQPEGLLPDWADLAFSCSHCQSPFCLYRAATLLAATAEFDRTPIKLLELRGAAHELLLRRAAQHPPEGADTLHEDEVASLFGIELVPTS